MFETTCRINVEHPTSFITVYRFYVVQPVASSFASTEVAIVKIEYLTNGTARISVFYQIDGQKKSWRTTTKRSDNEEILEKALSKATEMCQKFIASNAK